MHIKNTRRILCIGPPGCDALKLIKDLTGSQPAVNESGSIAGLSHELQIRTQYYDADVPIWVDEVADHQAWIKEFSQPEAGEVVRAIAAYIVCFTDDGTQECLEQFQLLLEAVPTITAAHEDGSIEAEYLAVVTPRGQETALSEQRLDQLVEQAEYHNFELIDHHATGRNEFMEKQGIERVREILEAVDWTAVSSPDDADGDLDELDFEDAEIQTDHHALKETLLVPDDANVPAEEADEALAVDDLEAMLGKLLAVKEQAADLPLDQRKRLAAKAVRDVMQQQQPAR